MNIDKELSPPSLVGIELTTDFGQLNDDLEDQPLIHDEKLILEQRSPESDLPTYLFLLIRLLIKALIILGQHSLKIIDKLMHAFRYRKRMRFFLSMSGPVSNILRISVSAPVAWIFIKIMAAVLILNILSLIYFTLTENKVESWLSQNTQDKNVLQNEALDELVEKNALVDSLLAKAKERIDRHENVPHDLAIEIQLAMRDALRLSNELFVAPEFLLNKSENGKGLTKEEIGSIPVEKYLESDAEMDGSNMCSICVQNYKKKQELRKLPCGHKFHVKCVDDWLEKLAACPNCKQELPRAQPDDPLNQV